MSPSLPSHRDHKCQGTKADTIEKGLFSRGQGQGQNRKGSGSQDTEGSIGDQQADTTSSACGWQQMTPGPGGTWALWGTQANSLPALWP